MIVVFTGGRDYVPQHAERDVIRFFIRSADRVFVGDASGADAWVRETCREEGVFPRVYAAAWEVDGRAAGPIRNAAMLDGALNERGETVMLVAFPGGKGTSSCIALAEDRDIPVLRVTNWVRKVSKT